MMNKLFCKNKILFMVLMSFVFIGCSLCKKKGTYEVVTKKMKIMNYDRTFVNNVFFSRYTYDLNLDGITEEYAEQINVYLDSAGYGKIWPQKVEIFVYEDSFGKMIDSSFVEINSTISGIGIFVKRRFWGAETHLKIFLVRNNEDVILDFDLEQKSDKVYRSRCLDELYKL